MRSKKGTNFSLEGELLTPRKKEEIRGLFTGKRPVRDMKEGDRIRTRLYVRNEQGLLHRKSFYGRISKILQKGGKLEVLLDGEDKPRLTTWRLVQLEDLRRNE